MAPHFEFLLLQTVVTVLVVATLIAYVFQWFRLPTVLGFMLTGVIIGPHGLQLIKDPELIRAIAQIGILFLLFIVGLELPLGKLRQLRSQAPWVGILQLFVTTLALTALLGWLGIPWQLAFLMGSVLSLSSTAIVLKNLEEMAEVDTVHGRLILGVLIIQDLSIIPLMTLLPTFSHPLSANVLYAILLTVLKAFLALGAVLFTSLKLVPTFLDRLASTHKKEIFTLSVVTLGLGMAFLTGLLGLSYEAGAFIAGLSLSGSLLSRQMIADSRPFRDVFATLFFVSVGLLVNTTFFVEYLPLVLFSAAILILIKGLVAYGVTHGLGFSKKAALWAGLTLFQVGEFSFVLLQRMLETASQIPLWEKVLSFWMPLLINAIVLSMFVTPLVIRSAPGLLYRFSSAKKALKNPGTVPLPEDLETLKDKIIIAGYGPIAKNLSHTLSLLGIPYLLVEMNFNTVKALQQQEIPCHFGDISHPDILKGAGIEQAKVLVLTFPDIRASEVTIQHARQFNPTVTILARCRYNRDIDKLYALGADEVIYEELETSLSFIFNTLHSLGHPVESINKLLATVREREEHTLREIAIEEQPSFGRLNLVADTKIEWLEIKPHSAIVGKTLANSGIESISGIQLLSIVDTLGKTMVSPLPEFMLKAHDILVVVGTIAQLHQLETLVGEPAS